MASALNCATYWLCWFDSPCYISGQGSPLTTNLMLHIYFMVDQWSVISTFAEVWWERGWAAEQEGVQETDAPRQPCHLNRLQRETSVQPNSMSMLQNISFSVFPCCQHEAEFNYNWVVHLISVRSHSITTVQILYKKSFLFIQWIHIHRIFVQLVLEIYAFLGPEVNIGPRTEGRESRQNL